MAFRERLLEAELGSTEAQRLLKENAELIDFYNLYDGAGQLWNTKGGLDYTPTKRITNNIKYLIKEVIRFMFSRMPEITIVPLSDDKGNAEKCANLESFVRKIFQENGFSRKLTKAGRDQLIAGRVVLKVSGNKDSGIKISFRPAIEAWADYELENAESLKKLIYLYQTKDSDIASEQRLWLQKFELQDGKAFLSEKVLDGNGSVLEDRASFERLPIDYIPSYIIINDGLSGEISGESEVKELKALAEAYNRLTSDDQDALRFSMFPQNVFIDAAESSLENIKVAPKAIIDLQTDPSKLDGQAKAQTLESGFSYDQRIENTLNRLDVDMRKMLGVPPKSLDEYRANGVSGKALKALYWPLLTKCEEKWSEWDAALVWLVKCLYDLACAYGLSDGFAGAEYTVKIEHLYPITDDEEEERAQDLREVAQGARSVKNYIEKWQPDIDSDAELQQIVSEKRMLEEQF